MVKKLFIILVIFICMLPVSTVSIKAESGIIENDETGIPDRKLYKKILKALKKKSDEKFTEKEAESIEDLWIGWGNDIATFKGLGYLKNLNELDCRGISTGDLEEIAAEVPQLKRLLASGYDEEWETNAPPVEERKQELDSLEPLRNMKHLAVLDVSDNNLTSLNGIEGLTKLKVLKADKNQIANAGAVKELKKLTKIYLSDNHVADLNGINNLINLKYLNLSNNSLTSVKGIGKLKKLEELYLSGNQIKKIGEIGQLKNLVLLYMENNQLTGTKGIKNLKNLESLSLDGNQLKKLGEISRLKNLESLSLNANRISTLTDSDMKNLKKLTDFRMFDNELKKLPSKKSLKKLSFVNFHWNYLTKKEVKNKFRKRQCEGYLYKWMWDEQKTGIQITYLSPDRKTNITKDTKEIVGKVTPKTMNGCAPDFYLLLPDGTMAGWDGKSYNAPMTDENGVFRIDGLDLRAYAGKEIKLVALFDYNLSVIFDRFTVQE